MQEEEAPHVGSEEEVQEALDPMSKRDRPTYEERVAEFLEPGELVEKWYRDEPPRSSTSSFPRDVTTGKFC